MSKKPRGNIHKIREFELEKIHLVDEFDILQIVGEGWFGKILLVEHRGSQTEMVLKAVPKPYVSLRDFYREFHYGLHLGIHRNIVTTYDVAFETAGFYVFTQEYAPLGDLTSNVSETGVGEVYSKRLAKQIAAAIDYMHTKDIVHRDIKLDNVLIYRSDFSRVKLCDFGESFQTGTVVERRNEWLPYSPPEVLEVKPEGTYKTDPSHDVWQFGIVIFVCLTGCLPWQKAASDDPRYVRYLAWQGTMVLPIRRTPKLFKLLTSRAQRMFKRFLEPRADRRPKNLTDLVKFLDDRWLAKTAEKEMAEYETDELCPSMYSFHSSPDEKNRLLYTLADCGIETNVDRQQKKNRIKDWIESSIITEEDEEEETNSASPSSSVSREPVPGHISSIRKPQVDKTKDIKTTLKDAAQKHFDPRTGALQQGPSEMGVVPNMEYAKSVSPSNYSNVSTLNNADSLLTLGSRQDLLVSNIQMYNSLDLDISRLGEHNHPGVSFLNQSLSNVSLLTANISPNLHVPTKNSIGVGTTPLSSGNTKSILQRSKSDSLKTAMYASSPAMDSNIGGGGGVGYGVSNGYMANTNFLQHQQPGYAPNGSAFFTPPSLLNGYGNLNNAKPSNNPTNMKSVTFTGLANAFHSLAHISLPANASLIQPQQQQHQQLYFNRQQNDSQVKDSAYGSTEVSDSPARSSAGVGGFDQLQQHRTTAAAHIYGGGGGGGMKDTAYDRVVVTNNNQGRRRI